MLVAPGEYVENINFDGKALSLIGNPENPDDVIIDGDNNGSVIYLRGVEAGDVTIAGLCIRNGESEYGGGINAIIERSLLLHSVKLENNLAEDSGGGALIWADTLRIIDVVFCNNGAGWDGGGFSGATNYVSFRDVSLSIIMLESGVEG